MKDGLIRIRIEGFASISELELEPGRLTVLIGPNGGGKSNVLRVLKLVPLLRTGFLARFVAEAGGAAGLLHYGPKRTQALSIELDFRHEARTYRYSARLGHAAGDRLMFLDESVGYRPADDAPMHMTSLGAGHWESELAKAADHDRTAKSVNGWIARLTFFHFHDTSMSSALRTSARAADDRYLRSDGSNLAAYLARLEESEEQEDQAAWRRINDLVRRIAPSVTSLSTAPVASNGGSIRLDWIDDRGERFGVHQLSDGTLRAIALVTALGQPAERMPRFISIDEPELGLHPAAIHLLAELARSVSRHTQVLFATQSTTFLDHFAPEEVVVVDREEASTKVRRLVPDELRDWLDDYRLSEIYAKGVLGGRP